MILLADPDANALADGAELTLNTAGGESVIEVLQIERGTALFTQEGQAIEHFGYADGRSQPLFFKEDIQKEIKHRDGTDLWDPSAPLSLVLAKDPASPSGPTSSFASSSKTLLAFERSKMRLPAALNMSASSRSPDWRARWWWVGMKTERR